MTAFLKKVTAPLLPLLLGRGGGGATTRGSKAKQGRPAFFKKEAKNF
jgi:hypothetical protein